MTLLIVLRLICVIFLVACRPPPSCRTIRGVGPLDSFSHTRRLIKEAPIVVVASIHSSSPVGQSFVLGDSRAYPVQLQRISVSVENVLRGSISTGSTEIFCFSYKQGSATIDGKNIEYGGASGRRVYFLDRDRNELRCFVDVYESSIPVYTGRHSIAEQQPANIEDIIAAMLLTIGEGPDVSKLSHSGMMDGVHLSNQIVGRTPTIRLLKPLSNHANEEVRRQACLALSRSFVGQDECLNGLAGMSERKADEEIRTMIANRSASDEYLIQGLTSNNVQNWIYSRTNTLDPYENQDFLLMLTFHRNKLIRRLSCSHIWPKLRFQSGCGQ